MEKGGLEDLPIHDRVVEGQQKRGMKEEEEGPGNSRGVSRAFDMGCDCSRTRIPPGGYPGRER